MNSEFVESEYRRMGYQLGWRVLYSPKSTLETSRVAFITLNPGGDKFENPSWSVETGNAYEQERWADHRLSPLQIQVGSLFAAVGVKPKDVLSGVLVPFRSPKWKSLPRKREALAFGERLWSKLLSHSNVELIVAMSKLVEASIVRITGAGPKIEEAPTGWGNMKLRCYEAPGNRKIVCVPHLSRFRIFSEPYVQNSHRFLRKIGVGV
jgi:hypothetical protein